MSKTINEMILAEARKSEGTWEWAGDDHNPKVLQMYVDAGHPEIRNDEVPWCAAFVGSVLARLGLKNTGSLLAKSYLKWGKKIALADAMPGDIVIFHRGTKSWQGHVGFIDSIEKGVINTLGGNQRNQVNVQGYSTKKLAGIRRVQAQRTNPAKSTTIGATGAGAAGTVATGVTAVGALEGSAQVIALIGLFIALAAFAWIFRERIRKWAQGDK